MAAQLLDGKAMAAKIKESLKGEVEQLKSKLGKAPHLAAVQVGKNEASAVYLKSQIKNAEKLGIEYKLHELEENSTQEQVEEYIENLNLNTTVTGIILQMPLPQGMDAKKLQRIISPIKDVEAMHPENLGRVVFGKPRSAPALQWLLLN